ncbi:tetratricopeptide repeat protein [Streptomyces virginiae]|uniref:tetratricopeptide repeat protein n=1 Tax=Streptomyces virginiae TaxID=1961 RepID=UPI0036921798
MGGWFEKGTPAKDFEDLWALVEVLLVWSGLPGAETVDISSRAKARARWTSSKEVWKARWEQAKAQRPLPGPPHEPVLVGTFPQVVSCFQDRALVGELDAALAGSGTVVLSQVLAGTGGVGKTQLAAHYAKTIRGSVDVQVWATATSRDSVVSTYAAAARKVCAGVPDEPEQAAVMFRDWLDTTDRSWLLVLDDVTEAANLLHLWPPQRSSGQCLITTRNRNARILRGRRLMDVGVFTEAEAVSYLAAELAEYGRTEERHELAALADDLGHLPLALAQAAAYMPTKRLTCTAYRARLAERTLATAMPPPGDLGDHQHTLAAVWNMSIEAADELHPAGLARPVLQLASMLDPNGIPIGVLTGAPVLNHLMTHAAYGSPRHEPEPSSAQTDAEEVTNALHNLRQLSLVDCIPDGPEDGIRTVRVHQLVQRAVRESLTADQRRRTARAAADSLTASWPQVERDTALGLQSNATALVALRANVVALIECAEEPLYESDVHPVVFRLGESLARVGMVDAAHKYYRRVFAVAGETLGPEHPDTLEAQDSLGTWLGESGDLRSALKHLGEALETRKRVLGPQHPDTLTTQSHMAEYLSLSGDLVGAQEKLDEVLDARKAIFGELHPETLIAQNNSARLRAVTGSPEEAAVEFEEVFRKAAEVLGPEHPDTLSARGNLAFCRGKSGNAQKAVHEYSELLKISARVMGPEHPDTLIARGNLARWTGESGDAVGAAAAFALLLEDMVRVLGEGHPITLTTRRMLDQWQQSAEGGHRSE